MSFRQKEKVENEKLLEISKYRDIVAEGIFNGEIQEVLSDFANESLLNLYPSSIIKRIAYRPMIGRWFPHTDVITQGYKSQLAFFFDELNMCLSKERFCALCGLEMPSTSGILESIPISICPKCFTHIYYDYWKCLDNLHQSSKIKTTKNAQTQFRSSICNNFFDSRCGYPSNSENLNPCLRNHAIGLILVDAHHLMIIIGRRDTMKYRMIWMGGLIGIILGFSNHIMNLAVLEKVLPEFYAKLYNSTDSYNIIHHISKITIIDDYSQLTDQIQCEICITWFLFSFLSYYPNFELKCFFKNYLSRPIECLKLILKDVVYKCELEILDYFELIYMYPPIDFTLRDYLESQFLRKHQSNSQVDISFFRVAKELTTDLCSSRKFFQDYFQILKKVTHELELKKILWIMGQFMLVSSNFHEKPILINMKEIIGRKFY